MSSIKRKKKICKECGESKFIYSKGRCLDCARKEYAMTTKKNALKKASKGKADKNMSLLTFYNLIWNGRVKKSFLSGKPLIQYEGTQYYLNMFAHVLDKGQNGFPEFKMRPENIILLTPEEHTLLDHGTEDQRHNYAKANHCSWEVVYAKERELLLKYNELYPEKARFTVHGRSL